MKFYYRTSSKGKCGCCNISFNLWGEEAKSKTEVIRRHKTKNNRVEVFTEAEAIAMAERHASIKLYN